MKIAVVGTGYVGLVSGACFAEFGWDVTCIDRDGRKIEGLQKGMIPIYEPGLDQLVQKNMDKKRLHFTTSLEDIIPQADVVFIAVGTPPDSVTGHADLSFVFHVCEEISQFLSGYTVIVTKSTVPVDTGRKIKERMTILQPKAHFDVVSNPEFLREGSAIDDFMKPDRVVVGCTTPRSEEVMTTLYGPLHLSPGQFVVTSLESAELIKYASNGFLATKIAFANEISDLCEKCGANVQDVTRGMGLDQRIGQYFLQPGPGYGGSCFPKDTLALAKTAHDYGIKTSIIETVIKSNEERKKSMARFIWETLGGNLQGKKIGILGVTFKANTDDMRDSPALEIIPILQEKGAMIQAFDPEGMITAQQYLQNIHWAEDPYGALKDTHACVILTEWNIFKGLDWDKAHKLMSQPVVFDFRNLYHIKDMAKKPMTYYSLGRPTVHGVCP
jgi:UDPglucose 6-dehydrogenase